MCMCMYMSIYNCEMKIGARPIPFPVDNSLPRNSERISLSLKRVSLKRKPVNYLFIQEKLYRSSLYRNVTTLERGQFSLGITLAPVPVKSPSFSAHAAASLYQPSLPIPKVRYKNVTM